MKYWKSLAQNVCRGCCFLGCTAASSHPRSQKDVLLQEEQLTSGKYPRCHVIKENEAKKKNSLRWVGGGGGGGGRCTGVFKALKKIEFMLTL